MQFAQVSVMILMFLTAVFLILLVLVQRGRGGGLAGALGGMGGQSAFGTKAGDVFTRITVGTAFIWILLCALSVNLFNSSADEFDDSTLGANKPSASASSGPAGTSDANPPVGIVEQPEDGAVPSSSGTTP